MISKEQMEAWVKALRSGDFKQGDHHLRYLKDGVQHYCCLGVLTELLNGKADWSDPSEVQEQRHQDGKYVSCAISTSIEFESTIEIPVEFLGWWPVADGNESVVSRLMSMNDDGDSFALIAGFIADTFKSWEE